MNIDMKFIEGGITAPLGFRAAGTHCGLRKNVAKKDLALIVADKPAAAAAVYTKNLVFAAPIALCKEHLSDGRAQAIVCNSGIANACCPDADKTARQMAACAAEALHISERDVVVASTGVIGQSLPVSPIQKAMPDLCAALSDSPQASADAAAAIMTTDTRKKEACVEVALGGGTVRIGAIAKGSGMIAPNMATMLCFLTTDADIEAQMLKRALTRAVEISFNMVSVDGDMSTNDMACILASGESGVSVTDADERDFTQALTELCVHIGKSMAADGEGATRLLEIAVRGASNEAAARTLAKSVVSSSLVKTALFGADANWGRVLCALGYAGVYFDTRKVGVCFSSDAGSVPVCKDGLAVAFDEEKAQKILSRDQITVEITLGDGAGSAIAWGCDLSYEYIRINGDYRS